MGGGRTGENDENGYSYRVGKRAVSSSGSGGYATYCNRYGLQRIWPSSAVYA